MLSLLACTFHAGVYPRLDCMELDSMDETDPYRVCGMQCAAAAPIAAAAGPGQQGPGVGNSCCQQVSAAYWHGQLTSGHIKNIKHSHLFLHAA